MSGRSIVPTYARTERALIAAAQSGNRDAIEYLVAKYPPLQRIVGSLLFRLDRSGQHHDDLRAAAHLALLDALRNYDGDRAAKFTTYAYSYVRGAMLKALAFCRKWSTADDELRAVRWVPLHSKATDDATDGDGEHFERELLRRDPDYGIDRRFGRALHADRDADVRRFVSSLADDQRAIVFDLFWHDKTHAEIAAERGVSRPAISRAQARVFKRGLSDLASHHIGLAA